MDRNSPGEMRGAAVNTSTTTISTTSTATNPARPSTPGRTQPLPPSPADRQAVQVIQQMVQRPQSTAAQYLQQMYAAQQQHILLQTAALQQQHVPVSQSLTTTQQPSQSVSRPSSSSPPSTNGSLPQSVSVSQTSITLSTTPLTAQSIGRIQSTCSTPAGGTISQQAMLLGNGSPTGSQAQMYLRTQMLILAPAATVAAVPSDLPAISPTSSQPISTQVQTLALRTHLPGALAQGVQLKPSLQGQMVAPSLPKMSISPLKSTQLPLASTESSGSDLGQLSSAHQLIAPYGLNGVAASLCPALVKHQLHCPLGPRGPHQLIIQQSASAHRQVQPIALRVTPLERPPPLSLQARTLPVPLPPAPAAQSQLGDVLPAATSTSEQPQSAALVSPTGSLAQAVRPLLQLGPLGASHYSTQSCGSTTVTTNLLSGALPSPPPASLQRLSLHSVQVLPVQSGQVLVSEEELPVAETLVQLPFQNLPPPQTVAVDLKMQSVSQTEAQSTAQGLKIEHKGVGAERDEDPSGVPRNWTHTPPTLSPSADMERGCEEDAPSQPEQCTAGLDPPCVPSSRSVIRSPEEPPLITSFPPPLHPAVVRSTSKPPATSLPESPEGQPSQAVVKPHILTHLIEGFVIHEGLEPFLVNRSSLTEDEQAALPESQEVTTNGDPEPDDGLMDVEDPENSSDSDMDDIPAEDEHLGDSLSDVLQCEFCGKRGYTHSFLRSKRFCSMTCVRRFNVSCTRRLGLLRAGRADRWPHRPMGKRGRPPRRADGISREHFLRQLPARLDGEEDDEDEPPGPMTTRLRRQAEREREQEHEREQRRRRRGRESFESDGLPAAQPNPSQWTVEQVCSYINSIPGCAELAEEFRSQEIDGQALLLLTEDHLVSAMNIKLGPALKICAQINTLKRP
ncbi:polyhomeotic-like protein 3 isoform X1 [Clupea harengus]|uniref:Polyhomeotic-like protein 3 isoform X1 n=1 Tax=Clupea harengus TaxID=7950 RepID=A0A6P8EID4_CLUHA|nr:polyhomeotic-like protein 3 isoform X1 [Clupea harengus]XP_031415798.1 polyhomeotic-like protein 3 isoform X1 [Clupea harengus]XP_042558968.1 polyhomeotic-like protein 3 isoform X1 [Clupea harengus]